MSKDENIAETWQLIHATLGTGNLAAEVQTIINLLRERHPSPRYTVCGDGAHDYAVPVELTEEFYERLERIEKDGVGEDGDWEFFDNLLAVDGRFSFTDPRND